MVFPTFHVFRDRLGLPVGVRMIREHSAWLNRMLVGSGRRTHLPRIPVRKVSEGGFTTLMSTPAGRYRAERWWERTLEKVGE